jgi:hypothetical protein
MIRDISAGILDIQKLLDRGLFRENVKPGATSGNLLRGHQARAFDVVVLIAQQRGVEKENECFT